MLINVNILCFINIGIPCKHLFGSFTASAIRSQHRTFFNINKNSQQIIFYDLRCESLFRMYEFLWNTWLIFSSVTVQYLTVTRKNPFQIGCADRIFAFLSKFSYGQRSKCADLLNTYFPAYINLETALRICGPAMIAMMIFAVSPGRYGITPMPRAATKLIPSCPASHAVPKI